MPEEPDSPLTELAAMAVQNHELYSAYVAAGFTEQQAMQILLTIISGAFGGAQ